MDPAVGRFTQNDPYVGFVDPRRANRYAYAGQDPINQTDMSGEWFGEDALDWVSDQTGLSGNELGGLAVDAGLGAAVCLKAAGPGCTVMTVGTIGLGLKDALDGNDDWWLKEISN